MESENCLICGLDLNQDHLKCKLIKLTVRAEFLKELEAIQQKEKMDLEFTAFCVMLKESKVN